MTVLPRTSLIALAFLVGYGWAAAQGETLAGPEQKAQQEKAQQSEAGRAGTVEPSSEAPTKKPDETAVFVDGRLAVPGAAADSQTVPAKFSKRNNALDELPTMAFPLKLTDAQRQQIRDAVSKANAPAANASLQPADVLPSGVEMRELPDQIAAEIPAVRNLGYVRTSNGILLVTELQRIVVEEVSNRPAN